MDARSELFRLRAIAYGRTSNADEERVAADALHRLRGLEAAAAAEPVEAPGPHTAPSTGSGNATVAEPVEAPVEVPRRRPWFWVAIAATLLLCFGAGFATASALRKEPMLEPLAPDYIQSPGPDAGQPQLSNAEKVEAGKRVSAAIAVLLAPLSEADRAIPRDVVLAFELNPNTTHLLTEPDTYPRVFGAKNMADNICLILDEGEGGWGSSCMPAEDFGTNGGITIGFNDLVYSWDGTTASSGPLG